MEFSVPTKGSVMRSEYHLKKCTQVIGHLVESYRSQSEGMLCQFCQKKLLTIKLPIQSLTIGSLLLEILKTEKSKPGHVLSE